MTNGGTPAHEALQRHYRRLQAGFALEESGQYRSLVVPNGNACAPVHRWFHLKEAFSSDLLKQVVADTRLHDQSSLRVLDPFAGVGTTAVSLANLVARRARMRVTFYGFECNPFIQLVGAAKLTAMQAPSRTFGRLARKVAAAAYRGKVQAPPAPDLSTFHNDSYFDRKDLELLLRLRAAIDLEASAGAKHREMLHWRVFALPPPVEPVSSLRRDGRALRYVPAKVRARPVRNFLARAKQVEMDMPDRTEFPFKDEFISGTDGRCAKSWLSPTFDLVMFSPPYPNNIDYTEVYKMEAWLLEMYEDASAFKSQRLKTVHSHPSIRRESVDTELSHCDRCRGTNLERCARRPLHFTAPRDDQRLCTGYDSNSEVSVGSPAPRRLPRVYCREFSAWQ